MSEELERDEAEMRNVADENFSTINWMDVESTSEAYSSSSQGGSLRNLCLFLLEGTQPWLAAALVGILAGTIASAVEVVTHWVTDLKLGVCKTYFWAPEFLCCLHHESSDLCPSFQSWSQLLQARSAGFTMYVALATFFAVLAGWLCREYAPYAAGSGIIEIKTILSGIRIQSYLDFNVLLIKCVGLCLSVGSGLSLGKEGPFVHVGCCIGYLVGKLFPRYRNNETASRELISSSAAAGVAVAFGAPIGGVLFSLEEVSYYFPHRTMIQAFFTATISTLVMKKLDPTHTGRLVQFAVSYRHQWHWFELFGFAVLGIIGGLVGSAINLLNGYWCRLKKRTKLRRYPLLEIGVLAFVTAIFNYRVPFLREGMLETLSELFEDCVGHDHRLCNAEEGQVMFEVCVAGCVRLVLMALTFGAKLPAGCFVPALFIGACLGRGVGIWMKAIVHLNAGGGAFASCGSDPSNCVIPGVYAIVGAAAVLAGVTRMTICLVVIMFELTGGLEYVVPCMLVTITSKWVAEVIGCPSIYEIHLALTEYPYLDAKEEFDDCSTVSHLRNHIGAEQKLVVLWNSIALSQLKEIVRGHQFKWFPVVLSEKDSTLVGCVSRLALMTQIAAAEQTSIPGLTNVFFTTDSAGAGYSQQRQLLDWSRHVDTCTILVNPETPVSRVLHIFKALGTQQIAVTRGAKLVGIITRKDLTHYLRGKDRASFSFFSVRGSFMKWIRSKKGRRSTLKVAAGT